MPFTSKILKPINQCNLTDIENEVKHTDSDSLRVYKDKQGRVRLVKYVGKTPVSGLLLEKYGKTGYIIKGVFTMSNQRRKGFASELFNLAKKKFKRIRHSDDLSPDGLKWCYSVEGIK